MLYILKTKGNEEGDFLRSSVCGYEGLDPRVCCPLNSVSPPAPTELTTSKLITSYGPLYPDECGFSNTTHTRVVGGIPAKLGQSINVFKQIWLNEKILSLKSSRHLYIFFKFQGAWPWIVALGYKPTKVGNPPKWLCGGTLVSSRHIVTAGHCAYNRKDLYLVRLGELDLVSTSDGANPIDILIEKITIHPSYSASRYTNDIAVIKMQQDVQFSCEYFIVYTCYTGLKNFKKIDMR